MVTIAAKEKTKMKLYNSVVKQVLNEDNVYIDIFECYG